MPLSLPLQEKLRHFHESADHAAPSIWITRGPQYLLANASDQGGALAGKLVAVKDNIDVAGFPTTLACPPMTYQPTRSARVVERLVQAGALVVGKTNLDQFACGLVGTRSPYGAVPNAFLPEYISGGSSSGSAVAVALGLVDIALGTDTAGSGRIPAGYNNIVGLKPSRGLISARGVFPACQHLDCVSIMTREVGLAAEVLRVCAGADREDPFSRALPLLPGFVAESFQFGVPGAKQLEFFGDALSAEAFGRARALLAGLGGRENTIDFAPLAKAADALYEDAWVAERYAAIRSFFDRQPEAIDPVVRAIIERGRHHSAADLFDAMVRMGHWHQQAQALWDGLDVLVVPTAPNHPTIAEVQSDPVETNRRLGVYTNFVNLLDLAAVAVPASMRPDGLPFGITLIGPAGSEWRLLDLAKRIHAATGLAGGLVGEPEVSTGPMARAPGAIVRVAVVGAHLDGLPLNGLLRSRGARLVCLTSTAPVYRLYALQGTRPAKPGLVRQGASGKAGLAIEAEIWELPTAHYGAFVAEIPAPLGIGMIEMADGSRVQGFLCEAAAVENALDISHFGGWRAYLKHSST
ncbi:MAG: allophanate hydrolase [Burkholderiaceae bacterium]|jgi:allophanate hydrolase